MLHRWQKSLFYIVANPLMRINGERHKLFQKNTNPLKVHLGPGQKNYIENWVNVDANTFTGKCDIWADLRNPLPFKSSSVDCIYSHHVIEHLPNIRSHLMSVFKCLKPGGAVRIGGPNGDAAIRKYLSGDASWFSDFPKRRKSIGGKFENFIFCAGEHLTILTPSFLQEVMEEVGFKSISFKKPKIETDYPELFLECLDYEWEDDYEYPHTIIVEAIK